MRTAFSARNSENRRSGSENKANNDSTVYRQWSDQIDVTDVVIYIYLYKFMGRKNYKIFGSCRTRVSFMSQD